MQVNLELGCEELMARKEEQKEKCYIEARNRAD